MSTPTANIDASLAAMDQADAVARKRQLDQVRHEIAGGDEAAARRKDAKLKEACQGFESIFLNKIWTQMRQSLPKEGYLHSKEEEFYQQMFDKELMDKMARTGGIGLGDMLYKHLKESSERASKSTERPNATEPLALTSKDKHQLAALQPRELSVDPQSGTPGPGQDVATAQDAAVVQALGQATGQTPGQDGLVQVAYAPYAGLDGDTMTDAASDGLLQRPELKPVPTPTIDLSKPGGLPAPAQPLASFDPDMPHDASQTTPLDLQAMNPETANLGGQTLGERLANAPVVPPRQQDPAAATPAGNPAAAAAVNPAQSRAAQAAQAYDKADRSGRTEGRRSNMPPIADPVTGELSSGYGWRDDPITGKRSWHSGLDIKAPEGTPVQSCWDGTVIFAGNGGQYGNTVVVEHAGGWRSFYGHAKDLAVTPGQKIRAGEKIATVGQSGRATGPHLHFEIRQGGLAWDPQQVKEHLLAGGDTVKKS